MSNHVLSQRTGRDARLELLCCSLDQPPSWEIVELMAVVGRDVVASHAAMARGQVLGPAGPLVTGSELEAFYCSLPMFWPDDFAQFDGMDPTVTIVWLVPISRAEASYVRDRGWDAFEDLLVEHEPDLRDWHWPSIV